MKKCKKCNQQKSFDQFDKDRGKKDGYAGKCKKCRKAHWDTYYAANRQSVLDKNAEWKAANPERAKRLQRDWNLRKKYGITIDEYEKILLEQDGRCAICLGGSNGKGTFHVDHCHKTKVIRGLLCSLCNTGIGSLRHDLNLLARSITYLSS